MPVSDLTKVQKTSLDAFMRLFRATCGEIARLGNHSEAVNTEYTNNASAILDELDGSDIIPNTSGLDGAEPMTKDEVIIVMSYMQGILAYNTSAHRALLARAAGESNLIG